MIIESNVINASHIRRHCKIFELIYLLSNFTFSLHFYLLLIGHLNVWISICAFRSWCKTMRKLWNFLISHHSHFLSFDSRKLGLNTLSFSRLLRSFGSNLLNFMDFHWKFCPFEFVFSNFTWLFCWRRRIWSNREKQRRRNICLRRWRRGLLRQKWKYNWV